MLPMVLHTSTQFTVGRSICAWRLRPNCRRWNEPAMNRIFVRAKSPITPEGPQEDFYWLITVNKNRAAAGVL